MSIRGDMQDDQRSIQEYHCLDIIDEWCRAGGTMADLYETLAFWPKCEAIARQRAGVDLLWYHLAETAEDLLVEAKAALRAGRLEELGRAWWPERVPRRPVEVSASGGESSASPGRSFHPDAAGTRRLLSRICKTGEEREVGSFARLSRKTYPPPPPRIVPWSPG